MSASFTRRNVEFPAEDGVLLRGWLFEPVRDAENERLYPAIVMTPVYGGVKELFLDLYAEYFAKSSFVVLLYDHQNFGDSDGEPRQEIDPKKQIQGYSSAITYLESLTNLVDPHRIGVWGSSYSGGHVLVVSAIDKRVKCVVSQMPSIKGTETLRRRQKNDEEYQKLLKAFDRDRKQRAEGCAPRIIPIIRPEVMHDWWEFFDVNHALEEDKWRYKNWKNEQTLHSIEMYGEYNPEEHIENISPCPLLMIVADNDTVTFTDDEIQLFEKKAREPKKLLIFKGHHFSAYKDQFEFTAKAANDWFTKYLQT
jgi:dienelactone hydrolase